MTSLRLEIEHECQELLVGELDPPTPIHVVLLECAGHGLHVCEGVEGCGMGGCAHTTCHKP